MSYSLLSGGGARSGNDAGNDANKIVPFTNRLGVFRLDLLRRLGVAERLWDTPPTLLSGGEQQRVNLACGLVVPAPA